jgi:iron complex outermembrane recepter protein
MMKSYKNRMFAVLTMLFVSFAAFSQTKITGSVTDGVTKETLAGVSLMVKGKVIGTITDVKGSFSLTTSTPTPFKLVVTSVGYESQEIEVTSANTNLNIVMAEQAIMGQEVVIAASRVEEQVMKSPVAVEKIDIRAIQNTPSASFYDAISNLKGVDMATQGLLFKSVNMRGFGATGNPRTVQMIDGMDNQAPGLNFPVDNIVGMPELDVESVEVLPGAASALYGPNAINGLILMNSKSPFLYQGVSASLRTGIMSASNRGDKATTGLGDFSIRYAKAFNNKFAFKTNVSYIQAHDWYATDYTNLNLSGNINPEARTGAVTDYDGMNVYGDEVQAGMRSVAQTLAGLGRIPSAAVGLVPNVNVSRTGFLEKDMVDPDTKSFKFNGALHYRVSEKVEAVAQVNYGFGTTLYTGTGRYSLKNFNLTQAKVELRGDNFTVRAYTTQERSGDSFTAGLAAVQMLNEIKPHATWFGEYTGAFVQARSQGATEDAAHAAARKFADANMPKVGTAAYDALLAKYSATPISAGGGSFEDKSNLYHAEAVYNFKNQIKFADVLAGANFRQYELRSAGTLFADQVDGRNGRITINEWGAFLQAAKSMLNDHFRLTGSVRYDKNQNFDGQFTPRLSGVFTFGDHNFRLSYQTGFRIPTTQNQYIDLLVPNARLIGGLDEFTTRYKLGNSYLREDVVALGAKIGASAASPEIRTQATTLITGQVTQAVTTAVNANIAAIRAGVTAAVTKAISDKVADAVTAGIRAEVVKQVTAGITQQVTAGVTAAITQQVTATVTQNVNQAVAAGLIENNPAAIDAAIRGGVAANLQAALDANLAAGVAAQLPAALAANLDAQVAVNLPGALTRFYQPSYDAELKKALDANLATEVEKALPGAVQSTIQSEIAKALPGALTANLPTVIQGLAVNANIGSLKPATIKPITPERIASYEIGYKGLWGKKLFVDAYYYTSRYKNFIGGVVLLQPTASIAPGLLPEASGVLGGNTRNVYSRTANSSQDITASGWGLGLNYSLGKGYSLGGNVANNELKDFTPTAEVAYSGYNTPKYRTNFNLSKRITSDSKFGFSIAYKYQDEFLWQAGFVQPSSTGVPLFSNTLVPSISNLDAQVSFKLTKAKTILKIGGTNIGGNPYVQAYGSPSIGSMYYVQLNFDELMN